MSPIKIIVAGDLFPSEENYDLFKNGDIEALYGKEINELGKTLELLEKTE